MSYLPLLFAVPFILALVLVLLPIRSPAGLKGLSFLMSLFPLLMLALNFKGAIGSSFSTAWFTPLSIHFSLGIDMLSYLFLLLMAVVTPYVVLVSRSDEMAYPKPYFALILLLQGLLIGFFCAKDLVVFTFFYEAMLLPLYFMISTWGGLTKKRAALKFLVYMIGGSVLMIVAVLALYFAFGTFEINELAKLIKGSSLSSSHVMWLAALFALAFAVKTPLFPFHAWLPDTYCQASLGGTILLSAVLSKAGIYGFLRIGREIFPEQMVLASTWLLGLAITGVLYGALAAWRQHDFKRLIAYSSFSHVNFILCGVFVLTEVSQVGAVLQSLNHALTIMALFIVAGWLEERIGTTSMQNEGGLASLLPRLCWFTLFFVLSSVALPGLNNFVGELMILFGVFTKNYVLAALLGVSIILSVIYMLRWMRKMYFGRTPEGLNVFGDLSGKEMTLLLSFAALMLWLGLYPQPLLEQIEKIFK